MRVANYQFERKHTPITALALGTGHINFWTRDHYPLRPKTSGARLASWFACTDRAPVAAADRAKRLEAVGDGDGAATWRLIAERCEERLRLDGTRQ